MSNLRFPLSIAAQGLRINSNLSNLMLHSTGEAHRRELRLRSQRPTDLETRCPAETSVTDRTKLCWAPLWTVKDQITCVRQDDSRRPNHVNELGSRRSEARAQRRRLKKSWRESLRRVLLKIHSKHSTMVGSTQVTELIMWICMNMTSTSWLKNWEADPQRRRWVTSIRSR